MLSPARKKLRLVKAYLRGYPIWVCWQATYACNFHCRFCSYWQDEVNFSAAARARESSIADFRLAAGKLARLGSLLISLAGGEPFLRTDLPEIVAVLAEQHFPLLTTNGSLVTEQNARALWDAGLWGISVSLDFSDAAAHDRQRGVHGAADRARRALQLLSRTRSRSYQRVNLLCVLHDGNLDQIEDLIRFAAVHDASFMVQPCASIKNGHPATPHQDVSPRLLALKRRYRNFISHPYALTQFDRFFREQGIDGCLAGRAFFNIDNFLNVQKCVEFRAEPIGNLRQLEPEDMLRRLRQEHGRNQCKACWYNCRGEVEALYSPSGLLARLPALLSFAADKRR